jgi:hypothetical protein
MPDNNEYSYAIACLMDIAKILFCCLDSLFNGYCKNFILLSRLTLRIASICKTSDLYGIHTAMTRLSRQNENCSFDPPI